MLLSNLILQLSLGAIFVIALPQAAAFAALYGVGVAALVALLSARSVRQSARAAVASPALAMWPIYAGLLQKYLAVAAGLGLGFVALELAPMYVVLGFGAAHLAGILAACVRAN